MARKSKKSKNQAENKKRLLQRINRAAQEGETKLKLSGRGISELPEEVGQLTNLQELDLTTNRLTSLPESFARLINLQLLFLNNNQFTLLPESVARLTSLQGLYLENNQLTSLPESIGQLTNLQELDLNNNQLTSLPPSIARLEKLEYLYLNDNPLNPALKSAYYAGLDSLRSYLRSLEEPSESELLYEAKLVFVGEGDVGKTTLLKALTGKEPKAGEKTTRGVSIERQALPLPHPEKDGVNIQFNAWDFGGQEIYRVTH